MEDYIRQLNEMDFATEREAAGVLRDAGFTNEGSVYTSADGYVTAVIKRRCRDARFYIVLFV